MAERISLRDALLDRAESMITHGSGRSEGYEQGFLDGIEHARLLADLLELIQGDEPIPTSNVADEIHKDFETLSK